MTARRRSSSLSGTAIPTTTRALGRAALARQHLLARTDAPLPTVVEQVGGLNAQVPNPPYVALWSRVQGFTKPALADLVEQRVLLRGPLHRATQRLVTADDLRWMRPTVDAMLRSAHRSGFRRQTDGLDLDELVAVTREVFADGPLTGTQLRDELVARFPSYDRAVLAYTAQYLVPLVALPSAMVWQSRKRLTHALADAWIGGPLDPAPDLGRLVRHHLAAFGPATPADVRAFSRVTGLTEVITAMRERGDLVLLRDEHGRDLVDLPDAPRPDEDVEAPVRFLPEFDELGMAYDDRRRVMADAYRPIICVPDVVKPMVLVDGTAAATWSWAREGAALVVRVELLRPVSRRDRAAVEAEGLALAAFLDETADQREVVVTEG